MGPLQCGGCRVSVGVSQGILVAARKAVLLQVLFCKMLIVMLASLQNAWSLTNEVVYYTRSSIKS